MTVHLYRKKRILASVKKTNRQWTYQLPEMRTACFFCCCCGCLLLLIGMFFIIFFVYACNKDVDCTTSNPCSIDRCVNNFCHHERKRDCCLQDLDCGNHACYKSFCDTFEHVCHTSPISNGTTCSSGDTCVVANVCNSGKCLGKRLSCDVGNPCRTGTCKNGHGCIYHNLPDGTPCSDNNLCTSSNTCYRGLCAIGTPKDCSHLDSVCSVGVCDVSSGECVKMGIHEGESCDDGTRCTIHDTCVAGTCTGELDKCLDNNPCTVDTCTEGGCVHDTIENDVCLPGCMQDTDCPLEFNCFDGTCVKNNVGSQMLRVIGYEIEPCSGNQSGTQSRLIQHVLLDTLPVQLNGETRYRIVKEASDIIMDPAYSPLGFGDTILHLAYNHIGNGVARTSFSIGTSCQVFTEENCAFIFSNREYRFGAYVHDCLEIDGVASSCLKVNHFVEIAIELSLSTCSQFGGTGTVVYPYGQAVLFYKNQYYREPYNRISEILQGYRGIVGIETNTADNVLPVISDLRVCQADEKHRFAACVERTNTTVCPTLGCYGWQDTDSPLSYKLDIIKDNTVTAIALSSDFLAGGCYGNENYNLQDKCTLQKCNQHSMHDFFEFDFSTFHTNEKYVFDILYTTSLCQPRRRLLQAHSTVHAISVVMFKN